MCRPNPADIATLHRVTETKLRAYCSSVRMAILDAIKTLTTDRAMTISSHPALRLILMRVKSRAATTAKDIPKPVQATALIAGPRLESGGSDAIECDTNKNCATKLGSRCHK